MNATICHFEIPCDDLEKAKEFYAGLFGWKLVPMPNMEDEYLLVQTSAEPGSLGGGLTRRGDDDPGTRIYVMVEDLDASADKIDALGGTIQGEKTAIPGVGWFLTATDPEGNQIGMFQEDKEAA